MKRLAVSLSVAFLLVLVAAAPAATPAPGLFKASKANTKQGFELELKVDRKGKRISNLATLVLERCTDGFTQLTTVGPGLKWKVHKNGTFGARKKEESGALSLYTTLKGKFVSRNRVRGFVRQESAIVGVRCDTGKLKFTAKRV